MKRTLVVFLLILTLTLSSLAMFSCNIGGTDGTGNSQVGDSDQGHVGEGSEDETPSQPENPEEPEQPENPEEPDEPDEPKEEHTHAYEYALINYNGGFALEGHCLNAGCNEPTIITDEGLVPEYEYVAPTCVSMGRSLWSYTKDGEIYTLSLSFDIIPGNHSYDSGICIYCGSEQQGQPDDPVEEHTHSWVDATCTTPKTCATCGEISGSALGHNWTSATCTEPKTCSNCGSTSGSAKGHRFMGWYIEVAPTLVSEGSVINECLDCNYAEIRVMPILTSGYYTVESTPESCTSNGQNKYSINIDGSKLEIIVVIYATGHSFEGGSCISCGTADPSYNTPAEHTHTDSNNDDKCDTCYESVVIVIDFYVVNDLHGKFCDTDTQPGVDNLATYLKDRYNYDENVIIFSSGDMWQGAAESNLTNGLILTEWMNELDFVSMTLGNHEYDWGEDAIRENLAVAEFPFLAINIYDTTTGRLADYCTPSVVVECDGIKIGIIGAIGDCYSSISSDMVTNVEFKVGSELTALVKAESQRLRSEGVDLIVYSLHDGYGSSNSTVGSISSSNLSSYYDTALSNGYVDLVFEGHTHQKYVYYDTYQVYHMQGGGENKGITHVEISLNFVTGKKVVNEAEVVANSVYSSYAEDPSTEAIEDKYADVIDMAYTVIGKVSTKQSSSVVADIVSELYLAAGLEKWGDSYNIVLGGGFIQTRSPYDLAAGDVTYSDVLSLLPFDNQLVLCSIKGTYLKSKFINTTNSSYHNTYSTYGQSIKNSISNNTTYYVIVDTYTAFYAPNNLTIVDYYDDNIFARDLLANEIKAGRFYTGGSQGGGNQGSGDSYTLTSIPEIISIGKGLSAGGQTSVDYYAQGTIKSITNTTYGNMYIVDESGNELLIYGLYDSGGNRYGNMTSKPQVGDTIIVSGPILYYNGTTVEIKNGTLISVE